MSSNAELIDSYISPTQRPVSKEDVAFLEAFIRLELAVVAFIKEVKHLSHDQSTHGRGRGRGFMGKPANPSGKDTEQQFKTPDGKWTPERTALHDKIVAEYKQGKTPVDNPVSYMMGGGTAAGKSSLLRSGQVDIPKNTVKVDSDEIKAKLPEYQSMVAARDIKAAVFVHEESSYLSKRIAAESSREGYNVMLDGTGDSSIESLRSKIGILRGRGQEVVGVYATVPTDMAVARSVARAKKTGRYVPEAFTRGCHSSVSKVVPAAIRERLFDKVFVYNTSERTPQKIFSSVGSRDIVHNQEGWDAFVAKGEE